MERPGLIVSAAANVIVGAWLLRPQPHSGWWWLLGVPVALWVLLCLGMFLRGMAIVCAGRKRK